MVTMPAVARLAAISELRVKNRYAPCFIGNSYTKIADVYSCGLQVEPGRFFARASSKARTRTGPNGSRSNTLRLKIVSVAQGHRPARACAVACHVARLMICLGGALLSLALGTGVAQDAQLDKAPASRPRRRKIPTVASPMPSRPEAKFTPPIVLSAMGWMQKGPGWCLRCSKARRSRRARGRFSGLSRTGTSMTGCRHGGNCR